MMQAAAQALKAGAERMRVPKPKLLAVTILTSHDGRSVKKEVGLKGTPAAEVKRLALLAQEAGCDGVVCSPREASLVRKACGPGFVIVTPGVRQAGGAKQDQKRTLTAGQAMAAGADYLVVGRAVTAAPDPAAAVEAMAREIKAALEKLEKKGTRKAPKKKGKR
jgi:orotidine-5'-phosphate decarboxylase